MYQVLLPTEGSEGSMKATNEALNLAKFYNAKVTAVFIIPEFAYYENVKKIAGDSEQIIYIEIESYAQDVLNKTKQLFENEGLELITLIKRSTNVAQTICKVAEEEGSDLILLGKKGIKGKSESKLGEISHKVAQCAKINVQFV